MQFSRQYISCIFCQYCAIELLKDGTLYASPDYVKSDYIVFDY